MQGRSFEQLLRLDSARHRGFSNLDGRTDPALLHLGSTTSHLVGAVLLLRSLLSHCALNLPSQVHHARFAPLRDLTKSLFKYSAWVGFFASDTLPSCTTSRTLSRRPPTLHVSILVFRGQCKPCTYHFCPHRKKEVLHVPKTLSRETANLTCVSGILKDIVHSY